MISQMVPDLLLNLKNPPRTRAAEIKLQIEETGASKPHTSKRNAVSPENFITKSSQLKRFYVVMKF